MSIGTLAALLIALIGCHTTPPTQLTVKTVTYVTESCPNGVCGGPFQLVEVPLPDILVWGQYVEPLAGYSTPPGTLRSYDGQTSASNPNCSPTTAIYQSQNLLLPAEWNHWVQMSTYCLPISSSLPITNTYVGLGYIQAEAADAETANNQVIKWGCNDSLTTIATATPSFAMAGSIPAAITVPGQAPFSTGYGMPILYLFSGTSGTPSLAVTVTATSVESGGGSATFPLPSSLAANSYGLVTANAMSGGSYTPNGVNFFAVGSSQIIEGNPFGVAAQAVSTSWQSAYNPDPYGDGTCAGQWSYDSGTYNYTVPVVTQYSLNSVNNGGATIPVGPNPTAIVLYDSQDYQDDQSNGPCNSYYSDTTQMARAIVANSGSNTVSILDLVNNAALSTITVGNQPVALAVSSDGGTAYVANYTDSTVTKVNLNTRTTTATVAVGGQPTSVALTAAGTLWVGGVGFLTQLNSQPMSVVATEPVTNKTIVALGFSNSVNQLVATTVDTSGNVYADEINPSTVHSGGIYSPLASNVVSSVGTHLVHNAGVRAFTSTLASASLISANQVGAPPLVVYDAWVAVTATPTGFTITDIADNYVFDSVSTPSPVTAIAIDPNLNVAYLVMPDSNILLTVPLPGTN